MLNGFGLEKTGIAALRRPIASTILVLVISLIAVSGLFRLGYSGANIDILRDGSQEFADYDELLSSFRNFNNDAVILLRGDSLGTVEGIETYRDLHFELQFEEEVESVLSLFSLVTYENATGGWQSALPAFFDSDEQVVAALDQLKKDIPNSQSLFSPEGGSAVIVVYVKPDAVQDAEVRETVRRLGEVARQFETEGLTITIAGQPAIRSDLIKSIVGDILLLLPIAALFCAIIAWVIFRSFVAVAVTVAAPLISVVWLLGGMGLAGIDINFLTNILPVLIVVVVFADTLHMVIKWLGLEQDRVEQNEALKRAVELVGPACVMSALTTSVALFSLILSGNNGLAELGIVGGLAMLASMFAVLIITPTAIYWAIRAGFKNPGIGAMRLSGAAEPAIWLSRYPRLVVVAGLVMATAGLMAHFQIESRYRLVDYLAAESTVAQSEEFIDDAYPGSTPLFAIVRLNTEAPLLGDENLSRFYNTLEGVGEIFPASSFYSLADFRDEIDKGGGTISESDLDALPAYLTARFISPDRDKALVTIFSSANLEAAVMRGLVNSLNEEMAARGLGEHVAITGFPVLSAVVAPRLMDNLRLSLIAAILISIMLIMVSAKSFRRGLACLVPNLLPVVSVELFMWMAGIPLNMSVTVALTVAFGIAVNNSIHLLNQYAHNRQELGTTEAMDKSLRQLFPAVLSTTLILVAGLAIMLFSSLPVIVLFSAIMILTLIFAILFDVFQLPAHILLLEKGEEGAENEIPVAKG
ncbi:MAG: efflux RND transporter permease subunit [Rhizobiaceae bacterium]